MKKSPLFNEVTNIYSNKGQLCTFDSYNIAIKKRIFAFI